MLIFKYYGNKFVIWGIELTIIFYSENHSTDYFSMTVLKFYCRENSCLLNKLEWIKFGIIDYHRTLLTFFCYSKRVIFQIVNVYTHNDTVLCLFFILQSIITSFRLMISSRNPKSYKGVTICLCFFYTSFVGLAYFHKWNIQILGGSFRFKI